MGYRYIEHAGNFADVFKHSILTLLLRELRKQADPFCYIETHAGAGLYDLRDDAAQTKGEHRWGIARLRESGRSRRNCLRRRGGMGRITVDWLVPE